MTGFEYKVVPAPMRGLKAKGINGTPARFANALEVVMNEMGAQGWEYQRTDALPVEERQGLTGKTTSFQHMLVFRRALDVTVSEGVEVAALIEDQSDTAEDPAPEPEAEPDVEDIAAQRAEEAPVKDSPNDDDHEVEAHKAAISVQREDRGSETLTAPFTFPWNKRRATPAATKDD